MNIAPTQPSKWYKEFWPWFIVVLLSSVVIASLVTVYLAFRYADPSIKKSTYDKSALVVQQNYQAQERVKAIQLEATLSLNSDSVIVTLNKVAPTQTQHLTLYFIHPFDQNLDFSIIMQASEATRYTATKPKDMHGRWQILLEDPKDSWYLKMSVDDIEKLQAQGFDN